MDHQRFNLRSLLSPNPARKHYPPIESAPVLPAPTVPFHNRTHPFSRSRERVAPAKLVKMNGDRERKPTLTKNGNLLPSSPLFDSEDETAVGEPLVQDFAAGSIPKEYKPAFKRDSDAQSMDLPLQRPPTVGSDDEIITLPPLSPIITPRKEVHFPPRTTSAQMNSSQRTASAQSYHRPMVPRSRQQTQEYTHNPPEPRRDSHRDSQRGPMELSSGSSAPGTPQSRGRASPDSAASYETNGTSTYTLPALQVMDGVNENDRLEPVLEDDPASFDLVPQMEGNGKGFQLEKRSDLMFSREHLEEIFKDRILLMQFTNFLSSTRPQSMPVLIYYLDALKALRAIKYANAIAESLEPIPGQDFSDHPARATVNSVLEDKADGAFDTLVKDDLPAYITHTFIQVVSLSIQRRITGTLPPHLRETSEGLAEVFCLTDPSRPDNPIVFASEEFHRTTQYGVSYAIGRNCRFLQGPRTNKFSVKRFAKAIAEGKEVSEVFLNYRRDGSPFMNLLMVAPLLDSRGNTRYFIGAQVDVSGLCKDCTDLQALQKILEKQERESNEHEFIEEEEQKKNEFQELSEILSVSELETIRKHGGKMHSQHVEDIDIQRHDRPRLLLKDPGNDLHTAIATADKSNGKLEGIYQNYLLVRPYPSLRILFSSPALRVPGMLQSPFLNRIGGSTRVRDELKEALAEGRGVTAKIRWISGRRGNEDGRARWIHCTPLLGQGGTVGVWMVVLVDEEVGGTSTSRRFRIAPPVADTIGGKTYEGGRLGRSRRGSVREGNESRPMSQGSSFTRPSVSRNGSIGDGYGGGSLESFAI